MQICLCFARLPISLYMAGSIHYALCFTFLFCLQQHQKHCHHHQHHHRYRQQDYCWQQHLHRQHHHHNHHHSQKKQQHSANLEHRYLLNNGLGPVWRFVGFRMEDIDLGLDFAAYVFRVCSMSEVQQLVLLRMSLAQGHLQTRDLTCPQTRSCCKIRGTLFELPNPRKLRQLWATKALLQTKWHVCASRLLYVITCTHTHIHTQRDYVIHNLVYIYIYI